MYAGRNSDDEVRPLRLRRPVAGLCPIRVRCELRYKPVGTLSRLEHALLFFCEPNSRGIWIQIPA
jgi:hypothetical protein